MSGITLTHIIIFLTSIYICMMIYTSYIGRKIDQFDDIDINSVEFSEVKFQSRWNFECNETNIKKYYYINRDNSLLQNYLDEMVDLLCAKYSFIDRKTNSARSFSIIIPIDGEIENDFPFEEAENDNILLRNINQKRSIFIYLFNIYLTTIRKFTIRHSNLLNEFIKQKKENISSVKKAVFNEFCMPVILDEQETFALNWIITFFKKGIATDFKLIPIKLMVENINEEYFRVSLFYEINLKLQLHEQYRNELLDDMRKCFSDPKLNVLGMVCHSDENPSSFPRYYVDNITKNKDFSNIYAETLLFYMNIIVYDKMRHTFLYNNLFTKENVEYDIDENIIFVNELNLDEHCLKFVNYDLINTMKFVLTKNIGFTNDLNSLFIDLLQKEQFLCDLIYIYLHENIYLRLYVLDSIFDLALTVTHVLESVYEHAEFFRLIQDEINEIKEMMQKTLEKMQIRAGRLKKQPKEHNRCNKTDLIALETNYQTDLLFINNAKENICRFFVEYLGAENIRHLKKRINNIFNSFIIEEYKMHEFLLGIPTIIAKINGCLVTNNKIKQFEKNKIINEIICSKHKSNPNLPVDQVDELKKTRLYLVYCYHEELIQTSLYMIEKVQFVLNALNNNAATIRYIKKWVKNNDRK